MRPPIAFSSRYARRVSGLSLRETLRGPALVSAVGANPFTVSDLRGVVSGKRPFETALGKA